MRAALLTLATAASLKTPSPTTTRAAAPSTAFLPALALRGGAAVDGEIYTKVVAGAIGLYAVQMMLIPGKMVSDHFEYTYRGPGQK